MHIDHQLADEILDKTRHMDSIALMVIQSRYEEFKPLFDFIRTNRPNAYVSSCEMPQEADVYVVIGDAVSKSENVLNKLPDADMSNVVLHPTMLKNNNDTSEVVDVSNMLTMIKVAHQGEQMPNVEVFSDSLADYMKQHH